MAMKRNERQTLILDYQNKHLLCIGLTVTYEKVTLTCKKNIINKHLLCIGLTVTYEKVTLTCKKKYVQNCKSPQPLTLLPKSHLFCGITAMSSGLR